MKKMIGIATILAMAAAPALAVTSKPVEQPSVQAQIEALKNQIAALQQQVEHLKASRVQQVCISLKCA